MDAMDRATTSQQDQISLYGLFGDSSATLQGLNDHLSPSLLQQSPPCGSAYSAQVSSVKSVTTTVSKNVSNGPHQGVLLSDFADRSPSAGSAFLCSHVSSDNLRCTNLTSIKGKRFCSQHSIDSTVGTSYAKKAIFKSPLSPTYLQNVSFPSTLIKSDINENVLVRKGQSLPVTSVGNFKLISEKSRTSGIDVSDESNFAVRGGNKTSKRQQAQVCFVRKVGQQITVTTRPLASKLTEAIQVKRNVATTSTSRTDSNKTVAGPDPPVKTMRLNPVKPGSTNRGVPYYKKIEPVNKSQMQAVPVSVKKHSTAPLQSTSISATTSASVVNGKPHPPGMDESMLKKLIGVFNSRNDLTTQQQISLLQSMGVTVVHASSPSANLTPKIKLEKTVLGKVITVSNPKPKKTQPTNSETSQPLLGTTIRNVSELHQVPLGTPRIAPGTGNSPLKAYTFPVNASNQATLSATIQVLPSSKEKKASGKRAQKRKQKTEGAIVKKSKSTSTGQSSEKFSPGQQFPNEAKKAKVLKHSEKSKHAKSIVEVSGPATSPILTASPPPKFLKVPTNASAALTKLVQRLNDKILLNYDLLYTNDSDDEVNSEADKNRTVMSKLLKRHLSKRRTANLKKDVPDYESCLKDLRGTSLSKVFLAARVLLGLFPPQGKTIHHEKMLNDLTKVEADVIDFEGWSSEDEAIKEDSKNPDTKIYYTVQTTLMRNKYNKLAKQYEDEKKEFDLLLECYKENSASVIQLLKSLLVDGTSNRTSAAKAEVPSRRRCQLSSDSGLGCSAPALPYASYCKQHIWHCQSQCLYKLDQNMKPTADISPEPMVKRVRKRTKLLPLIKKYKKKKKRKIEGNEGSSSAKEDLINSPISIKQEVQCDDTLSANFNSMSAETFSPATGSPQLAKDETPVNIDESDEEDAKPSDTSEEDLHLTTHEIMLSGVLDKLPDDPNDFDLFTTSTEELERALMLAASSPTPDHEENKLDIPPSDDNSSKLVQPITKSNSHQDYGSRSSSVAKHDNSPNAIINCDAPKSNEQPPSLESFNQSQCVHYTFGSNLASASPKKECRSENFEPEEDITPPLISAEDLQDIEGVLERLQKDAEDENSPKLPSSPAVDQYTCMLARQLSQEAETESLKQQSSSISRSSSSFSLARTYSLPTSKTGNASIKVPSTPYENGVASQNMMPQRCMSGVDQQKPAKASQTRIISSVALGTKNAMPAGDLVLSERQAKNITQSSLLSQPVVVSPETSLKPMTGSPGNNKLSSAQDTPRKLAKKSATLSAHKVPNPTVVCASPRSVQGKVTQSPAVLANQVLPLTQMQGPTQSGNVIRVIVPPGTVVNGGGVQNMLLIPVSALMKSNIVPEDHNIPSGFGNSSHSQPAIKTQLSSLQAGQQFFILNNNPGSTQTHLALVQKPNSVTTGQQGPFLKPLPATVPVQKDENTTGQMQPNRDTVKRSQITTKPGVNACLKQNKNLPNQSKVTGAHIVSAERKPHGKTVGVQASITALTKSALSATARDFGFGKFPVQPQVGRRGRNPAKKLPKAKFDPITKTYVPGTPNVVAHAPRAVSTETAPAPAPGQNLTESLKKFNASTLSIQNKVQQIDSVLSSLNSGKSQPTGKALANGHQERKTKDGSSSVKSVVLTTANQTKSNGPVTSNEISAEKAAFATPAALPTSGSATQCLTALSQVKNQPTQAISLLKKMSDESALKKANAEPLKKSGSSTAGKVSDVKFSSAPVSGGTVHWNQTTTAGPEITTPTLTVPVYITSAIPTGSWPTELAVNGQIAGTSLPVLLPAHKISPNCQLPQRVLLGSIGSLAVPSQTPITLPTSSSQAKQPRVASATHVKSSGQGHETRRLTLENITSVAATERRTNVTEAAPPTLKVSSEVSNTPLRKASVDVSLTKDETAARKKSGRKTSHDTILHDPLMFDPTSFEQAPSTGLEK